MYPRTLLRSRVCEANLDAYASATTGGIRPALKAPKGLWRNSAALSVGYAEFRSPGAQKVRRAIEGRFRIGKVAVGQERIRARTKAPPST